jgi:hypothetical protein
MLYPCMVCDFMMWRNDLAAVKALLPAVRSQLELFLAMRRNSGLLGIVPGWPFVDWVPCWNEGCGPGVREGDSSIVNLHLVLALQAGAQLEAGAGDDAMATRWTHEAEALLSAVLDRYWSDEAGALLDTTGNGMLSEHAQVLALLTRLLGKDRECGCLRVIEERSAPARCSVYFDHYRLEALYCAGRTNAFHNTLRFWRDLPAQGFVSLPEQPEPSRSDCHAWGAHPLFHTFASIAGIRPATPGFSRVRIAPLPGPLTRFSAQCCHPRGTIHVGWCSESGEVSLTVTLPAGIEGEAVWNGETRPLHEGDNQARWAAGAALNSECR